MERYKPVITETTMHKPARTANDDALTVTDTDESKARRKFLRDLAKAPRSVRMAAIASSARAMANAPALPEESELTDVLGGEDLVD